MKNMFKVISYMKPRRLFSSWICLPFTAGNRTSSHQSKVLDGQISTLVILACLVAPSLVIMLVSISHEEINEYSKVLISSVLTLFTVSGLVSLIAFLTPYFRLGQWRKQHVTEDDKSFHVMWNIRLFFLLFFCMGFYAKISFEIIFDILRKHSEKLDIVYKILTLLFCFSQTLFLCMHKRRMVRTQKYLSIRYGMIMIIAADISIWFYTLLSEARGLYTYQKHNICHHVNNSPLNQTTGNFSTEEFEEHCALVVIITRTDQILSPMVIEYCLLSIGLLLRIWSHRYSKEECTQRVSRTWSVSEDTESTSPKAANFHLSNFDNSRNSYHPELEETLNPCQTLLRVFGVFVAVFLLVLKYFVFNINKVSMYLMYEQIQTAYILMLLFLTISSFYFVSKNYQVMDRTKPLKVREYLLVFCCFGTIFYLTFTVVAGAKLLEKEGGTVIMVEFIIDCLSVYFQTTIMLLACRLNRKYRNNSYTLNNVFIIISSLNLAFWTVDGFVTSTVPYTSWFQNEFYGKKYWYFIAKVIFPFTIYFRFHSFVEFLELSLKV